MDPIISNPSLAQISTEESPSKNSKLKRGSEINEMLTDGRLVIPTLDPRPQLKRKRKHSEQAKTKSNKFPSKRPSPKKVDLRGGTIQVCEFNSQEIIQESIKEYAIPSSQKSGEDNKEGTPLEKKRELQKTISIDPYHQDITSSPSKKTGRSYPRKVSASGEKISPYKKSERFLRKSLLHLIKDIPSLNAKLKEQSLFGGVPGFQIKQAIDNTIATLVSMLRDPSNTNREKFVECFDDLKEEITRQNSEENLTKDDVLCIIDYHEPKKSNLSNKGKYTFKILEENELKDFIDLLPIFLENQTNVNHMQAIARGTTITGLLG